MFVYPLVGILTSFFHVEDRILSISFRLILVFICIGVIVAQRQRLRLDKWRCLLLLVWATLVIRLFYDWIFGGVEIASYALYFFLSSVLMPVFALWSCNEWDDLLFARLGLLIAGASSILSLVGDAFGLFGEASLTLITGRLSMIALNPISLGNLASSGIFCAFVLGQKANFRLRSILAILIVLLLMVLVATGSKSCALALALPLLAWLTKRRAWFGAILSVFIMCLVLVFAESSLKSRLGEAEHDPSTEKRMTLIEDSIHQIIGNPLIGSSFVELKSGYYPHSIFLEAPMAFGIPLSLAVFLLLAYGSLLAWRGLNSSFNVTGLLFLQGLIGISVSGSMFSAAGLWIPMALMLNNAKRNPQAPDSNYDKL